MGRHKDGLGEGRTEGTSPQLVQPYGFVEHRLRGRDSQAEDDARLQHLDFRWPFAEDGLRGLFIQLAAGAGRGGLPQIRDRQFGREKGGG